MSSSCYLTSKYPINTLGRGDGEQVLAKWDKMGHSGTLFLTVPPLHPPIFAFPTNSYQFSRNSM